MCMCSRLATLVWFLVMVVSLHVRPGRMEHRDDFAESGAGWFRYVRRAPMLLGSFSLDLFVVLLGGATALMPIFAHDILHQGPRGLGMLRAAPAVGAVTMSLVMARFPLQRRAGRWLFICVAIFGAATVVFGLSHTLWLSLASLAIAGAADTISVIIRGSLLQLATPPEMRGRVSAVNSLFIGASNELGEFESGLTAQWWGAVRATVIGGIGSLAVAGVWAGMFPDLRKADELTAESLRVACDPAGRRRFVDGVVIARVNASVRAAARARGAIALKENAQAVEREHVVDLLDVARVGSDHARQAAAGDDARRLLGVGAKLRKNALDDAVDEADVAEVNSALQVADGVGADDLCRALDVDAAQARGAREERVGAEAEAGRDGAAEIFAARGDHFKFCGRAEVDHDAWAAVALEGGDAVGDAIGAKLGGIVDEHLHAGLDAWLDEHRLDVEVGFAHLAQRGVDGRHHRSDDDVRDLAGRHAVHLKEVHEEDAVLVDGLRAMRGDAPVRGELGLFAIELVEAESRVGVADIESEQHVYCSS